MSVRVHDFAALPVRGDYLVIEIDFVDAVLTGVIPSSTNQNYPRATSFILAPANGAGINTELNRLHARITTAATNTGRPVPANGTRINDFTTGNVESARLHADFDRLYSRIERLKHFPGGSGYGSATKTTDNTGTGIWPGTQFVSLQTFVAGSRTLELLVVDGSPDTFQWRWNGVTSAVFAGWANAASQTITLDGGATWGKLTFITDSVADGPPQSVGGTYSDTVVTS